MATTPRLLLIETSGRAGCVAVATGSQLGGCRRLEEARRHARDLAPAVGELVRAQGWQPRQVEAVVVSLGPGSYTGLRVGLASAKVFAYATGCALVGVETFAVLAQQAPPEADTIAVVADAQQGQVYVQQFARTPTGWRSTTPLTIGAFAGLVERLAEGSWLTGPGLLVHGAQVPARLRVVDPELWQPQIESLLAVGLAK